MVFKMKSFKEIEDTFVEQVKDLCRRGNHDVLTYEFLKESRREPVQLLYTVIEELKKSDLADENKALVASGIAIIAVAIIKSPPSFLSQSLLLSIGVSQGVMIDPQSGKDTIDPDSGANMLREAMNFLDKRVFTDGNPSQPLLENHVFFTKNNNLKFDDYYYKGVEMLADFSHKGVEMIADSSHKAAQMIADSSHKVAQMLADSSHKAAQILADSSRDNYKKGKNVLTITIREREAAERQAKNKDAPSYFSSFSNMWSAAPKKVDVTDKEDNNKNTIRYV